MAWIWLRSMTQTRLCSLWWAMNRAASQTLPSSSSPSDVTQKKTPLLTAEPGAQCHPRADRQPMPQASGRKRDLFDGVEGGQRRQLGALFVIGIDLTFGENVGLGKHGVEGSGSVPFGQDEGVVFSHPCKLQKDQNLRARQRAADVSSIGLLVHGQEARLDRKDALREHHAFSCHILGHCVGSWSYPTVRSGQPRYLP